jgi:hypothetical protein
MYGAAACVLLVFGIAGGGTSAFSLPKVPGETERQLSPLEMSALHGGSAKYPYATPALLDFLEHPCPERHGSLYLGIVPTYALTTLLVGSRDRDAIATLLGMLQWNPYSGEVFFVRVSWSVRPMTSGARLVEFHTELLSEEGDLHHPPLEAATAALLEENAVRFLAPASAM